MKEKITSDTWLQIRDTKGARQLNKMSYPWLDLDLRRNLKNDIFASVDY